MTKPSFPNRWKSVRLPRLPNGIAQAVPAGAFVLIFFNIPIVTVLLWAFRSKSGYFDSFVQLTQSHVYMRIFGVTLYVSLVTTVLCAVLGYMLAYWMWRMSSRGRVLVLTVVVLTFWISILVRTYSWIVVLGNDGVVNRSLKALGVTDHSVSFLYNQTGVIIGTCNVLLPFLVLPLFASMTKLDPRLFQAAETMGASQKTIFLRIFLPLTLPALAAGSLLVFILTLGFYITPAVLGGGRVPMIANMLDMLINRLPRWEVAAAICSVLLVFTLLLFAVYQSIEKGRRA